MTGSLQPSGADVFRPGAWSSSDLGWPGLPFTAAGIKCSTTCSQNDRGVRACASSSASLVGLGKLEVPSTWPRQAHKFWPGTCKPIPLHSRAACLDISPGVQPSRPDLRWSCRTGSGPRIAAGVLQEHV